MDETTEFDDVDVTYNSRKNILAGTLSLPKSDEAFPSLVLLGGSERSDRTNFTKLAHFFAKNGIASLRYDFPGTGQSTGNRDSNSFDDRKNDALSGLEFLHHHERINKRGIGLWGGSQGGWIVQLAAAECDNLSFAVIMSGPGISPSEQVVYSAVSQCREANLDQIALQKAHLLSNILLALKELPADIRENTIDQEITDWHDKAVWLQLIRLITEGNLNQCRIACAEALRKWDGEEVDWVQVLRGKDFGITTEDWLRAIFEQTWPDMQPSEYIRKINCPLLACFGEKDPICPTEKDVAIYKMALRESPCGDYTIKVFRDEGHVPNSDAANHFVADWLKTRFNPSPS